MSFVILPTSFANLQVIIPNCPRPFSRDYLTLYRRLNHRKRLIFFDYLGGFKATEGPGANPESLFKTEWG